VAEWIAALSFLGVLSGKLPSAEGEKIANGESVAPVLELPKWTDIRPLVVASSAVFLRSIVLQVAMSSAAAMAARSTAESDVIASGASSSVAAHQIALQLWLLCSFLCDALATASQALVADGIGRKDAETVRTVSRTVFNWGLGLGLTLSAVLWIGTETKFLIDFFTSDVGTRIELTKLLTIVILAQPLNSFVFAADGVLQGAEEFAYQAKSMALSVLTAFFVFAALEYTPLLIIESNDTLVNVWLGLIALQAMRALTSLVKLIEQQGPINLLGKQPK
jgi:Na+-driven multidrug efflux pump